MNEPNALTGLGCTSHGAFADQYRGWLAARNARRKVAVPNPRFVYAPCFRTNLPTDGEVYLIETVAVFLQVRGSLPATATAVVSDSPLLLSELPGLQALDWIYEPWRFRLQAIDMLAFDAIRTSAKKNPMRQPWADCRPVTLDRLGLVIDETASGTLLTPMSTVTNNLDHIPRAKFRAALARYLNSEIDLTQFSVAARQIIKSSGGGENVLISKNCDRVIAQLKASKGLYQEIVASLLAKRAPTKLIKSTKITPYECRFLARLASAHTRSTQKENNNG